MICFSQGGHGAPAKRAEAHSFLAPGRMQVYVLDVGKGQSVLVISPAGKAALVDAGSEAASSRVVDAIRRRGIRNLEVVVATQAGADYVGGLRRVAASSDIVIKSFVDSSQPWKTDAYQQTLAAVQSAGIPIVAARRGQLFDLGGGARLDILNPAGDGNWIEPAAGESRENANSVIVRLLYRDFVMLIMSGAGAATAAQLLEARQNIWAPFLLVGAGGAPNSVSEKMLSIVQPKFAIISTAASGPPADETVERLKAVKAEIYRTDASGEISITSDGKKHEIAKGR
ncbi:MAG TPA: MBL fold metallo-hydrolase [Pyrinomonadaceae bacterium]|nr:MBL fold metallo-hydrolase [Pyrinomonadaceae bacterium]